MDWKEAPSGIQFIAGVEFGAFEARAFRIRVAGGGTRALCRMTESEEREVREAIRRGGGGRVARICRGAEMIAAKRRVEAARLFPRSRRDEMTRIVTNRERFERMTEARFQPMKPQECWMFQTASESWRGFVE
jgi:hypothetical protein